MWLACCAARTWNGLHSCYVDSFSSGVCTFLPVFCSYLYYLVFLLCDRHDHVTGVCACVSEEGNPTPIPSLYHVTWGLDGPDQRILIHWESMTSTRALFYGSLAISESKQKCFLPPFLKCQGMGENYFFAVIILSPVIQLYSASLPLHPHLPPRLDFDFVRPVWETGICSEYPDQAFCTTHTEPQKSVTGHVHASPPNLDHLFSYHSVAPFLLDVFPLKYCYKIGKWLKVSCSSLVRWREV